MISFLSWSFDLHDFNGSQPTPVWHGIGFSSYIKSLNTKAICISKWIFYFQLKISNNFAFLIFFFIEILPNFVHSFLPHFLVLFELQWPNIRGNPFFPLSRSARAFDGKKKTLGNINSSTLSHWLISLDFFIWFLSIYQNFKYTWNLSNYFPFYWIWQQIVLEAKCVICKKSHWVFINFSDFHAVCLPYLDQIQSPFSWFPMFNHFFFFFLFCFWDQLRFAWLRLQSTAVPSLFWQIHRPTVNRFDPPLPTILISRDSFLFIWSTCPHTHTHTHNSAPASFNLNHLSLSRRFAEEFLFSQFLILFLFVFIISPNFITIFEFFSHVRRLCLHFLALQSITLFIQSFCFWNSIQSIVFFIQISFNSHVFLWFHLGRILILFLIILWGFFNVFVFSFVCPVLIILSFCIVYGRLKTFLTQGTYTCVCVYLNQN